MKAVNTREVNNCILKSTESMQPEKKHKCIIYSGLICLITVITILLPIILTSYNVSGAYAVDLIMQENNVAKPVSAESPEVVSKTINTYQAQRKTVKPASWALMNFIISMVGLIFAFLITSSILFYNKDSGKKLFGKKRKIPISLICVLGFSFSGILVFFLTQSFKGMPLFINSLTPVHVVIFIITMINFIIACKYIK